MSETNYMAEANFIAAAIRTSKPVMPPARPGRSCKTVTPRALEVLAYMREFFNANDQLPPMASISKHFGWSSNNGAQDYVNALLKHGLLERNAVGKLRFPRPAEKGGAA